MAVSILLLLLLGAALAYFILPEYIVFTAEGFRFTFQSEEEPPAETDTEPEDEELHIVIDDKPVQPEQNSSTGEETGSQPLQAPVFPAIHGVGDSLSSLLSRSGYAKGLAKAALERGCNTLFFSIKAADGLVHVPMVSSYSSQQAESGDADSVKAALDTIADQEIYLAARIHGFRDNAATRAFPDNALKISGSTWLDASGDRWLDPYGDMAAEYLCDLIRACKNAGFDAIVFDDLCFPTRGQTDRIDFSDFDNPNARRTRLEEVYQMLRAEADALGISLSIVLEGTEMEDAVSGQYAADLAKYFHTIFVEGTIGEALETALTEAIGDTGCRIGLIHSGGFTAPANDTSVIAGYLQ